RSPDHYNRRAYTGEHPAEIPTYGPGSDNSYSRPICFTAHRPLLTNAFSKVIPQVAEGRHDDQFPGSRRHRLVFEMPCVYVWNVNGIQSRLHRGIDIAAWTVPDHPSIGFHYFVLVHQKPVCLGILLC